MAFLISGKIEFCILLQYKMWLLERKVQTWEEIIWDREGFQNIAC